MLYFVVNIINDSSYAQITVTQSNHFHNVWNRGFLLLFSKPAIEEQIYLCSFISQPLDIGVSLKPLSWPPYRSFSVQTGVNCFKAKLGRRASCVTVLFTPALFAVASVRLFPLATSESPFW